MIRFLELDEILEIYFDQIQRYGGKYGIRNLSLLESAVAMPKATFGNSYLHKNVFEMAAAYAYYICKNHPFIDGNKRTALAAALVFLELNNISLIDPSNKLYQAMIDLANNKLTKNELANIFEFLVEKY